MKHYVLWGLIVAAFFLLSSCGSSKKIQEKSPVATFIMPGADLVSGNGVLPGAGVQAGPTAKPLPGKKPKWPLQQN